MKIYLGADHRGFKMKEKVFAYLTKRDYDVVDCGNKTYDPDDDFTAFAQAACLQLLGDDEATDSRAILMCGGAQGMAMAANRFDGIRAAVVNTRDEALLARKDNNTNVISLPADELENEDELWQSIIDAFLTGKYAKTERYERRNNALDEL